tara:strand:- start:4480 stop:5094 length:615 start_codon:yes stop_codon:yes gene_type:complete
MAELNRQALAEYNPFQGPIPGQSLTNSEDSRQPWEQPPVFTNIKEAREAVFLEILKEENLEVIINLLDDGMSVAKVTEMLLFIGYSKGQFNPDLMMLLAEPVMYMLLALCEAVGIEPIVNTDDGDDPEEMTAEENEQVSKILKGQEAVLRNPNAMENMQKDLATTEIPAEIKQRLEGVDFKGIRESLLAKPDTPNQPESLLQRK